jgi:hypothetical protein
MNLVSRILVAWSIYQSAVLYADVQSDLVHSIVVDNLIKRHERMRKVTKEIYTYTDNFFINHYVAKQDFDQNILIKSENLYSSPNMRETHEALRSLCGLGKSYNYSASNPKLPGVIYWNVMGLDQLNDSNEGMKIKSIAISDIRHFVYGYLSDDQNLNSKAITSKNYMWGFCEQSLLQVLHYDITYGQDPKLIYDLVTVLNRSMPIISKLAPDVSRRMIIQLDDIISSTNTMLLKPEVIVSINYLKELLFQYSSRVKYINVEK